MAHKARSKKLPPIHPGEVLEDTLREAGLSASALAIQLRVPANRITAILNGKRGITADTALRLARYFSTSAEFWMSLQLKYDIEAAEDALADRLNREIIPRNAA
jgi:addiction module HigA family antidote